MTVYRIKRGKTFTISTVQTEADSYVVVGSERVIVKHKGFTEEESAVKNQVLDGFGDMLVKYRDALRRLS